MARKSKRYNSGKPEYSLIDYQSLEPLVRVLMFGSKKYSRNNWRLGFAKVDLLDSLQRHVGELIDKVNKGLSEVDEESGELIIGHIMANCLFYSYHHRNKSFSKKRNNPFKKSVKRASRNSSKKKQ